MAKFQIDFESRIGFIDVKTSAVQFYVQRNTSYSSMGTIPWEMARLNTGNAMNVATGVFTAPQDGVYHFHFSCYRLYYVDAFVLRLNNAELIGAAIGVGVQQPF